MTSSTACLSVVAPSLDATHAVAGALATLCRPGDVVVLAGEMGAGKTAFAQGFGWALGVTEPITSPTFTLVHTYDTPRGPLHHADIYRLGQLAEVADLALGEMAEFNGIVLVEWGDVIAATLGQHLEVRLELDDDTPESGSESDGVADTDVAVGPDDDTVEVPPTSRRIRITAAGPSWAKRWSVLTERINGLDLAAGSPC
jgi:tRNA threonylcarbamoyladenosine biosynthesis protein TsaE